MQFFKPGVCLVVSIAMLAADGAASAQSLDVKPGLWEIRIAGMPEAQQVCYTAEVLDGGLAQMPELPGVQCENQIKESTPRLIVASSVCTGTFAAEGETRLEVPDRETMVMVSNSVINIAGNRQTVNTNASYKWLRADCGDVKPFDPKNPLK